MGCRYGDGKLMLLLGCCCAMDGLGLLLLMGDPACVGFAWVFWIFVGMCGEELRYGEERGWYVWFAKVRRNWLW